MSATFYFFNNILYLLNIKIPLSYLSNSGKTFFKVQITYDVSL
jgi:hypothetical protein